MGGAAPGRLLRPWSRSATWSTSISATASTTSPPIAARARSCSTSRRSPTPASSCRRRAPPRATKPVVVIKSGRHAQGARAAATHTGALAGSDAVYEAAFRRAGLLRVFDLDELFAAAETLGRQKPFPGKRLAILTNGGGVGVLAVDRLIDLGGTLAALSPETLAALDARCRRPGRARTRSTSSATRTPPATRAALEALLADEENDAVLVLNVPTALASASQAAEAVVGDRQARPRRRRFAPQARLRGLARRGRGLEARLRGASASRISRPRPRPCAASCISCATARRRTSLMETPDSLPRDFAPDAATARADRRRRAAGRPAMARPARGQPASCAPTTSRSRR